MKKEEVEQYLNHKVKVILKGSSGNIYQGTILKLMSDSFIILDKLNNEVTIDYELCGLITPIAEKVI